MPRIQVWTPSGVLLMRHENADLIVAPDSPYDEAYVEVRTPDNIYEYFGPTIVERVTEEKEGE